MKRFFKIIGILAGLAVVAILLIIAFMPWMDRWGATGSEVTASFPGDGLSRHRASPTRAPFPSTLHPK